MTSEPIRRSRDERWISLERWWSLPEVTFTSKSVRFSAAAPIAAKCVRRQHMQPSKDRRYSITSSASASNLSGIARPSALAFMLMTSSNLAVPAEPPVFPLSECGRYKCRLGDKHGEHERLELWLASVTCPRGIVRRVRA
jgi:hypothetical protein